MMSLLRGYLNTDIDVDGMLKIWAKCEVRGEVDKCHNFVNIMYKSL